MTANLQSPYDDEIDLRALILKLWRGRWVILAVTLITALVAFVISAWVGPNKYQAISYISIKDPILNFTTAQGLTVNQKAPDITSLINLATAPSLMASVRSDPTITAVWGAVSFKDVKSAAIGQNLLLMQVTDTNPKRAAQLSNVWASQVSTNINTSYGTEAIAHSIILQVTEAQQRYDQAQNALLKELSDNRIDILTTQLNRALDDLNCIKLGTNAAKRVLNDLLVLKQRLEAIPTEESLTFGDALAMTTLQQRALSSRVCNPDTQSLQIQFNSDSLINIASSKALESISQIQVALQNGMVITSAQQTQLEQQILQLKNEQENARDKVDRLTTARDLAKNIFETLTQQMEQNNIVGLAGGNQIANVSLEAVVPSNQVSRNVLRNTALAGVMGFMLSIFGVWVFDWWKETRIEK